MGGQKLPNIGVIKSSGFFKLKLKENGYNCIFFFKFIIHAKYMKINAGQKVLFYGVLIYTQVGSAYGCLMYDFPHSSVQFVDSLVCMSILCGCVCIIYIALFLLAYYLSVVRHPVLFPCRDRKCNFKKLMIQLTSLVQHWPSAWSFLTVEILKYTFKP